MAVKIFINLTNDIDNADRKIAASLGIPIEKAERFGAAAQDVYANKMVDSVTEGADKGDDS